MVTMLRTFKYQLYPTKSQRTIFEFWLELCRWVYNKTLWIRKSSWEENQTSLNLFDTNRLLTQWKTENLSLKKIHSQVLQNVQRKVDEAFKAFFLRLKRKETPGYPRFKSQGRLDSFCFPQYPGGCHLDGNILKSKLLRNIKLNLHRPVEGVIKTTTFKKTPTGKWFVSFSCEVPTKIFLSLTGKSVGIDLGLENFFTKNDGEVIENPRFLRRDEKDLKRLHRKVSASPKGSVERRRNRLKLCKAYERISNRRLNFAHQTSRNLVNNYDVICLEKLNVIKMLDNHFLAKSISDAAWNIFVRFLTYKAEEAGRSLIFVDPAYTSQICSSCGNIVKKSLSTRTHRCECGLTLGRDHNAALNILRLGTQSQATSLPRSPLLRRGSVHTSKLHPL